MTTSLQAPSNEQIYLGSEFLPSVDEVYQSAIGEHPEFVEHGEDVLKGIIFGALERIDQLEEEARMPLTISPETAENVETIWIFSGTGSYDERFKPEDNPRLQVTPWLGGMDRARLSHGARIARKIAEVRSGQADVTRGPLGDFESRIERTRKLIAEFGPTIVYNGYLVETRNAEDVLGRDGLIIPAEKAKILHADLKFTSDQFTNFEYADTPGAKIKDVVIVSHAPHLGGRITNIAKKYDPFTEGSVPYLSPVPTPVEGRREFAMMEARGLLWYIYGKGDAAGAPHTYRLLTQPGLGSNSLDI